MRPFEILGSSILYKGLIPSPLQSIKRIPFLFSRHLNNKTETILSSLMCIYWRDESPRNNLNIMAFHYCILRRKSEEQKATFEKCSMGNKLAKPRKLKPKANEYSVLNSHCLFCFPTLSWAAHRFSLPVLTLLTEVCSTYSFCSGITMLGWGVIFIFYRYSYTDATPSVDAIQLV